MIHKYEKNGIKIVLDVNSDSIHIVDDIIYQLLDYYPNNIDAAIEGLKDTFKIEALKEAMDEIDYLINENQLFSKGPKVDTFPIYNKPVIKAMCLHVAHDCNIRCKYCFASQGDFKRDRSIMSLEVGKKALLYLAENSGNHYNLEVDFFGGEPLLNFDVVKKLVAYGRSLEDTYNKNFRFTLTTNGILLNKEVNAFINEHMDNVVLSIDGRKEVNDHFRVYADGRGTYDQIIEKYDELIESREKLYYVRGTFTHFNLDFSKDIFHLADIGYKSLSVEPVVTDPDNEYALKETDLSTIFEEYDLIAEKYISDTIKNGEAPFDFFHYNIDMDNSPCYLKKIRGCGAGLEYIAVTPKGDIYPCHQFVEDEDFKMGTVYDGITNHDIGKTFKGSTILSKEGCSDCFAKFHCSGGCHANAYNINGDINKPYSLGCKMQKKRLENAIYIKAKLAQEGIDG